MKVSEEIVKLCYKFNRDSHYPANVIYMGQTTFDQLASEMEQHLLYQDSRTLRPEFNGDPIYIVDAKNFLQVGRFI